jgi:hypothetical protein
MIGGDAKLVREAEYPLQMRLKMSRITTLTSSSSFPRLPESNAQIELRLP